MGVQWLCEVLEPGLWGYSGCVRYWSRDCGGTVEVLKQGVQGVHMVYRFWRKWCEGCTCPGVRL